VTAALGSTEDIIEMLADSADITDPDSMRPLVDLVLAHNNLYFPPMSPAIEDLIKTKLIEAEIAYRQGRGAGVRDQSLADAFNALAAKFHSTASGLTSQLQVRLLRMQLSLVLAEIHANSTNRRIRWSDHGSPADSRCNEGAARI
jgi:hypothetical protein